MAGGGVFGLTVEMASGRCRSLLQASSAACLSDGNASRSAAISAGSGTDACEEVMMRVDDTRVSHVREDGAGDTGQISISITR